MQYPLATVSHKLLLSTRRLAVFSAVVVLLFVVGCQRAVRTPAPEPTKPAPSEPAPTDKSLAIPERWIQVYGDQSSDDIFYSVATQDSRFVAVGTGGTILHSDNGVTWTRASVPNDERLYDVTSNGVRFVAVGSAGTILHSSNGEAWTEARSSGDLASNALRDVTWRASPGLFVAVGTDGVILHSEDGDSWSPAQSSGSTTAILEAVAWSESAGRFVAVGQGGVNLSSADGNAWRTGQDLPSSWLIGVSGDGPRIVAVGDAGKILQSNDGLEWSEARSGGAEEIWDVVWTGSQFITVGDNGQYDADGPAGSMVLRSIDGISWTTVATSGTPPARLTGVAWNGNRFVAVGFRASIGASLTDASESGPASALAGTWQSVKDELDEEGTLTGTTTETLTFTKSRFIAYYVERSADDEIVGSWAHSGAWNPTADSVEKTHFPWDSEADQRSMETITITKPYVIEDNVLFIHDWESDAQETQFRSYERVVDPIPGSIVGVWTFEATPAPRNTAINASWTFTFGASFTDHYVATDVETGTVTETFSLTGPMRHDPGEGFLFVVGESVEGEDSTRYIGHERRYAYAPTGIPNKIAFSVSGREQEWDESTSMLKDNEASPYGYYEFFLLEREVSQ